MMHNISHFRASAPCLRVRGVAQQWNQELLGYNGGQSNSRDEVISKPIVITGKEGRRKQGFEHGSSSGINRRYEEIGGNEDVSEMFEKMHERTVVFWNSMITRVWSKWQS